MEMAIQVMFASAEAFTEMTFSRGIIQILAQQTVFKKIEKHSVPQTVKLHPSCFSCVPIPFLCFPTHLPRSTVLEYANF